MDTIIQKWAEDNPNTCKQATHTTDVHKKPCNIYIKSTVSKGDHMDTYAVQKSTTLFFFVIYKWVE
jgi:hypothetical protein